MFVGVPATFTGARPGGTVGTGYDTAFTPAGTAPVTFAVTAGALPAGLVLSAAGRVSGTPTAAGTSTFSVTATNDYGSQTRAFTVTVARATTTTTLASSAPDLLYRGSVRWTATVARTGTGTPTGTVQFRVLTTNLGAPVPLVNGVATSPATTSLAPGATTVTAVYSGGPDDLGSTGSLSQVARFQIRITSPAANASFRRGSTVPVQFQLTDAVGTVPDLVAAAWLLGCRTQVSATGAQTLATTCATTYDTRTKLFTYGWRTDNRGGTGAVTVTVGVTYPGVTGPQTSTVAIRLTT